MLIFPEVKTTGTLSEKTYEILKRAIIELELKPGKLITVEGISEQLGISRTPIRTALNNLINENLIEMIPGKGTFVKNLSQKEANDLFGVRDLLECYSVKLATELRTEEDVKQLEYILRRTELVYKGNCINFQEFLTLDSEFHNTIAKISTNSLLKKQIPQILDNSRRYLNATTDKNIIPLAIEEHRALYEQIENKHVEKAVAFMHEHIYNIKERIIRYIVYNEDN